MELVVFLLLAYAEVGAVKAARDLAASPLERPFWTVDPTIGKAVRAGLLWWWESWFIARVHGAGASTVVVEVVLKVGFTAVGMWGWYSVVGLVIQHPAWHATVWVGSYLIPDGSPHSPQLESS